MPLPLIVETARTHELRAAFRLMYQHLSAADRDDCVHRSLQLVESGDLRPEDILVLRSRAGLRGVLVCCAGAGVCGQLWPPQAAAGADRHAIEDALIQHGLARINAEGVRFIQCLLPAEDHALAPALTRNGFQNPTALLILRHVQSAPARPSSSPALTYCTYEESSGPLFAATLMRTYEGTLDFPELNGLRTAAEIMDGHKAHGVFDPTKWFLALHEGLPVGLLLLTELPDVQQWELAYLGVVPEARGRGIGRALVRKALAEAGAVSAAQLTIAVDGRNQLAQELYQQEGFELCDVRDVYLIRWPG
jgi:GNAT superfamily N-acetyltransferase